MESSQQTAAEASASASPASVALDTLRSWREWPLLNRLGDGVVPAGPLLRVAVAETDAKAVVPPKDPSLSTDLPPEVVGSGFTTVLATVCVSPMARPYVLPSRRVIAEQKNTKSVS